MNSKNKIIARHFFPVMYSDNKRKNFDPQLSVEIFQNWNHQNYLRQDDLLIRAFVSVYQRTTPPPPPTHSLESKETKNKHSRTQGK